MFRSFFPQPKLFFSSAALWGLICVIIWYGFVEQLGAFFGMPALPANKKPPIGLAFFLSPDNLWFYLYFALSVLIFGGIWRVKSRDHKWANWAIWGSSFIVFIAYFSVQISVAINNWRGPFWDAIQKAMSRDSSVTVEILYGYQLRFLEIAAVAVTMSVITAFFTNHYVFRWRIAMNDYYTSEWKEVRHIEGASQRIQEDTMRFAQILENLGISLVNSIMTLVVFLPILFRLSENVSELPVVGYVPHALFWLAIIWAAFGTCLLAFVGKNLPGLHFNNQKVEAAYRKELVYGEDNADRADPITLMQLFSSVKKNYFRMYWHYLYFNVARFGYNQVDRIFLTAILIPTFVAGKLTMGLWQQVSTAFRQVTDSFQYLVSSWVLIIELLSIYKRLVVFENAFPKDK
ncbi:peptide antibiotic transporter SbmA [Brucellaceae bacterium C25G]